jgi:putative tryptophan/tyrosine transport system substrate-binding protein
MRRRALFAGLAVIVAAPRLTRAANEVATRPRVAIVGGAPSLFAALLDGLHARGWIEGRNFSLLRPAAGDPLEAVDVALREQPDAIFLSGPYRIAYAAARTRTIPLVGIDLETDPVESGLVESLARPGGNVTGVWLDLPDLAGKLVEILREAVPELRMVAIIGDDRVGAPQLAATEQAARQAGIAVDFIGVHDNRSIEEAIRQPLGTRLQALILLTSPALWDFRGAIADLALKHHLPSISIFPSYAVSGGLLGYGPNQAEMFRMAARQLDLILRGRSPAELPVERPAKFEVIANLQTARVLGLTLPASLLASATEVIE